MSDCPEDCTCSHCSRGSLEHTFAIAKLHVERIAAVLPLDEEADRRFDKWLASRDTKKQKAAPLER